MGANGPKAFPLVAWDDVYRPKSEGGLGIRKNEDVNRASIAILSWKILTDNDSFWARIMRDKYVKNINFFRFPKKKRDFNVWKEIIYHGDYVEAGLKWCIGDGRKVLFWTDNWVYMMPLVFFFVEADNLHLVNLDAKVHDLINHETKEWNIHSVSTILPPNVISDIRAIPIPCSLVDDRILWGFSQDGKLSLKSTTWAMRKPLVHPRHKTLNWIWKLNLLMKIKVFLWLTIREALPTCDFLIARRLEITNTCYFCNKNSENIDHIFKLCPFAQGIWDRIKYKSSTPLFYEGNFLSWLESVYRSYKIHRKFSNNQWKKLQLSFGVYGPIGIKWYLGKSSPTPFNMNILPSNSIIIF